MPEDHLSEQPLPEKLYSDKSISLGAFLGGPLAAAILLRRNFLNLKNEKAALYAVIIGTLATLVIIGVAFAFPTDEYDTLLRVLIPAFTVGLSALITEKTMGKQIARQKEVENGFYSSWKAAGVALVTLVILLGCLLAVAFYEEVQNSEVFSKLEKLEEEFSENENRALKLNSILENEEYYKIDRFVTLTGIPAWQKNLQLLEDFRIQSDPEGLFEEQISYYENYCNLRIRQFELYRTLTRNDTTENIEKLRKVEEELQELLD